MDTRKFLSYGSMGFFGGFCTLSMARGETSSEINLGKVIAGATWGPGLLLAFFSENPSVLLPYTLGVIAGAVSNTLFLNGLEALEHGASASSHALKM